MNILMLEYYWLKIQAKVNINLLIKNNKKILKFIWEDN